MANSSGVSIVVPVRTGIALDELGNRGSLFLFPNLFVLLLVGGRLEALPWQATSQKVEEYMT
jgi:hypothetical protein